MSDTDDVMLFYDTIAQQTFDEWFHNPLLLPVLTELMTQLPHHPLVLDLGCGTGGESNRLIGLGASVVGVDISGKSIELAIKHVPRGTFFIMDIMKLDLPHNHFHAVLDAGVLFHFGQSEQNRILKEIGKLLVKDGILLSIYPDGDSEGIQEILFENKTYKRYVRHISQEEWIGQVMGSGFLRHKKLDFTFETFRATMFYKT